jgi:hypothetical protein
MPFRLYLSTSRSGKCLVPEYFDVEISEILFFRLFAAPGGGQENLCSPYSHGVERPVWVHPSAGFSRISP